MSSRFAAAAATALLLGAALSRPAAAQAIAYGEPPPAGRVRSSALAESYRVRLTSAWPQSLVAAGCENGGEETVEGTLIRTGAGDYAGSFTRKTRLLFCGAHGATGQACALVLEGEGKVVMRGVVVPDEEGPTRRALRVVWTPGARHAVTVAGECGADFKQSVERMYLSARHGAEFALPDDGAAPRTERLEDYAWVVEVE